MRNTFAEINLSNLIFNYKSINQKVGDNVNIMPVVKADAYGHGMIECVKALLSVKPKPHYFAVALLEEALEFKKFFNENILVFGRIFENDFKYVLKYNITPTFWVPEDILKFNSFCKKNNFKGKFHLEIDTGMRRTGIQPEEADDFIDCIKKSKFVNLEGVFTHFATSDCKDKTFAYYQLNTFKEIKEKLTSFFPKIKYFHSANSGAIIDLPESYFNMVRPGISLYGYYPSTETSESIPLKPVMSIVTNYTHIKKVKKNTSVSYGQKYWTKKDTTIITLPVGYADGYNRLLSNKGKVIINKKMYPVVGRVCMDYIMIDVGNDEIKNNDRIILLGNDDGLKFDADDMSRIIKTIPYEICTSISKRTKRIYIK